MKYKYLLVLTMLIQICQAQTVPTKEIYNSDFQWRITLPEDFENVDAQEWAKMQDKGAAAIEATYDQKIINRTKTIFVFKSGQFNIFESNYQPFDVDVDGDYIESCVAVNTMLYETFRDQMPGVKIDTARSTEIIDHLEFQKFAVTVEYSNKMTLHALLFSRLFDKQEFSVNITYTDEERGKKMLESWKNSKFGK